MRIEHTRRSRHAPVARAMDYMLNRRTASPALRRRTHLPDEPCRPQGLTAGARVPRRAMYTLVVTAMRKGVNPRAWFADVLTRIASLPHTRVHERFPRNWKAVRDQTLAA